MDLKEKALELGRTIRLTDQYQELERADGNLKEDNEAHELVKNMQKAHEQMGFMQKSGVEPTQDQLDDINKMQELMKTNITIQAFVKAQEEFSKLLQEVNASISEGISGGEEQ